MGANFYFKAKFGHGLVPIKYSANPKLGKWAPHRPNSVTTIELVVTTVESVRDSKSERTSLLNDTIVRVKL